MAETGRGLYHHYGKRALDLAISVPAAVLLSPLLGALALVVRRALGSPVLFRQVRPGRMGRPFLLVKFRTMRDLVDGDGAPLPDADRLTPFGRFLRSTSLDELPQLWNVLTGRMSFVGPRPDVPGYADRLHGEDRRILDLRPGITGPATLLFREEERLLALAKDPKAFNDEVIFPEKVRINREYLETASFWRDIGYILATVAPGLVKRTGAERRLGLDGAEFSTRMEREAVRY